MKALSNSRRRDPTIYDVATRAAVSISTVSRVLNSPLQVRETTRRRVVEAMEELSFVPKAEASARARRDFKRIGVLTPFFTAPSFVQRLRGVASALVASDHELIVYAVESFAQLGGYLDMLPVSRRIDGLIIMSLPIDDDAARHIMNHHLETVCVEYNHALMSSVEIDNREGGRLAAEYLLSKGYRRCAFIGEAGEPAYSVHPSEQRLGGFMEHLAASGISLPESYISRAPSYFSQKPFSMETVVEQTEALLDLPEPPEAIFTSSDIQAVGVLKAATQRGIEIPGELAVIGFDNLDIADYIDLTTIDQSLDESGRAAVELLMRRLNDHSRPPQSIRTQLRVVERSTA